MSRSIRSKVYLDYFQINFSTLKSVMGLTIYVSILGKNENSSIFWY